MKRIILIGINLLFSIALMAQIPSHIKERFSKNILELDPIEGVYDGEFAVYISSGREPLRLNSKTNDQIAIYKVSNNVFKIWNNDQLTISRIGDTNAYNFTFKWSASAPIVRVYLEGKVKLEYQYDLPKEQILHDTGRTTGRVVFTGSLIKVYPTSAMYVSAAEETQDRRVASEWSGTGFALNNGYIVTNYHVVDGAKQIEVHGVNGYASSNYLAEVVALDKNNDLAIIRINDYQFNGFGTIPYSISSQMIDVGEDVWVLGYPLTQVLGNEIKLTNGVISSRSGYQGDVSTYQISAPVQPGNSGGPLFDSKGNIIGVVNAGVPGADNVGYAIKTSYLKNLADSYSLSSALPTYNSISSLSLKEQVKRVKNFVFLLLCSSEPGISKSPATSSLTAPSSTTKSGSSFQSTQVSVSSNKGGRDGRIDSLNQSEITIKVGDKFQLLVSPESVKVNKWETDNYKVAGVSADGVVTGLGKGQTNIWVHGPYNTVRCLVTVKGYFD